MTEENKEEIPKLILLEDLGMLCPTKDSKYKARYGRYKCGFCGTEFRANTQAVLRGKTKSCGCYNKIRVSESTKKHGLSHTRLYHLWNSMNMRVYNPQYQNYNGYGGRGITVCDEWKNDVKSFYDWAMSNGYSDELSLDRIDSDGNYEPSNCRWATKTIQSRNQRISKNNTSGYKGVSYDKKSGKYRVKITVNKKGVNLGYFQTAVEAGIAYNNYIIENNLEGFILNEIPEVYQQKNLNQNIQRE